MGKSENKDYYSHENWITNNKKKRKRQPVATKHYTIPSKKVKEAIKHNNQLAQKYE